MARRRPARRVKTVGGRPFRLDDAVGIAAPPAPTATSVHIEDLSGRARLDERIAQAARERARFEARARPEIAAEPKG